jgi:hypothetical protein
MHTFGDKLRDTEGQCYSRAYQYYKTNRPPPFDKITKRIKEDSKTSFSMRQKFLHRES